MKVGSITESQETFSYKNQRFSDQKFIICVRDERYEFNVKTIISVDNNKPKGTIIYISISKDNA